MCPSPLDERLQSIDFFQTEPQLQQSLQTLHDLSDAQVAELASGKYVKNWRAGLVLRSLSHERLLPHVVPLLGYLQDVNWPAFDYVLEVVQALGPAMIPAIQHVFPTHPRDGDWMERLLWNVVDYWQDDWVRQVQPTLVAYVRFAQRDGASIAALETLERVLLPEEHFALYHELRTQYADSVELTVQLQNAFHY
jgi:hypothetical protein